MTGGCPFTVSLRGVGVFPGPRAPRVLWADCATPWTALERLYERIEAALSRAGWPPAKEAFRAHVTLARIRRPAGPGSALTTVIERFMGTDFGAWPVSDLVLFRSHLRPDGAVYEVVQRFAV